MYKLSIIDKISFILVIIGALAWGIYGLTNLNIVHIIFGSISQILERIIYIMVGISGINLIRFIIKSR